MTNTNYVDENEFPIEESLCYKCAYRFSRKIVPIDFEDWGIDLEEIGVDEDDEVIIEQHVCLIMYQDLDGIVYECNRFAPANQINPGGLFINNPF